MDNLLSITSAIVLLLLIGLHLIAAGYFWRRLLAGHNGVTFALLVHMVAVAVMLAAQVAVVIHAARHSPAEWRDTVLLITLISRLNLLVSTVYLVAIAKIEAAKPLKKQTWTRERLYRTLRGDE